jgi:hypothetical protein
MSRVPYFSAVGSLMYAMVCSRIDLSHALSVVSRFMANPGEEHWRAVQWIFRYLRGISNACLQFGKSRDGLVMLILILLVIWIRGDLSRVMFSPLVVVLLAEKHVCSPLLLYLQRKLNIWLFLKLVKKLFG